MTWTLEEILKANQRAKDKIGDHPYKVFQGHGGIFIVERKLDLPEFWIINQFDPETGGIKPLRKRTYAAGDELWLIKSRKSAYRQAESLSLGLGRKRTLIVLPYEANLGLGDARRLADASEIGGTDFPDFWS